MTEVSPDNDKRHVKFGIFSLQKWMQQFSLVLGSMGLV